MRARRCSLSAGGRDDLPGARPPPFRLNLACVLCADQQSVKGVFHGSAQGTGSPRAFPWWLVG
jgi:hypothetical protein